MLNPAILCLLVVTVAWGADPFVTADNPFQSGWKSVAPLTAKGLYSDGRTVVAWGDAGYAVSRDSGFTWTNPIQPSSGHVGAPGAVPVAVADAVVATGEIFVRTVDGAVRGGDGIPRNPVWNIGAVSRMAVDGRGTLYAELADGTETVAIARGAVSGRAPGRLVGAFAGAAATWDGRTAFWFDGASHRAIAVQSQDGRPDSTMAPACGPGTDVLRDHQGGSWNLRPDALTCTGRLQTQVTVVAYGACDIPSQKADAIGLIQNPTGVSVVVNAGDGFGNALRPVVRDIPLGLIAICFVRVDEHGTSRFRLLGATAGGLMMYRSP